MDTDVSMKPNYAEKTRPELRKYVLSHTDDQDTFFAFVDLCHAENRNPRVLSLDRLEEEIFEILQEKGLIKTETL